MTLEFLGVGSYFAKRNFQNNLLINGNILIDCGMTAGRSLHETKRTFARIDHIFITHTHADHIGGLEECAFFNKYVNNGAKPNLYLPAELTDTLWKHSLRGGLEDIENDGRHLSDYFNPIPVDRRFEIQGLRFEIIPTVHVPGKFCCGLRIEDRIYFSGDTQFMPDTVCQHGQDTEAIYHDCQFFTGGIHTSLSELATLPEPIRRKTWLMHYGDDHQKHIPQARGAGFRWAKQHTIYTYD